MGAWITTNTNRGNVASLTVATTGLPGKGTIDGGGLLNGTSTANAVLNLESRLSAEEAGGHEMCAPCTDGRSEMR